MTAKPASETVRSPGWIAALVAVVGVLGFVYAGLLAYSYGKWITPDYSHGFLVPLFAGYLAWMLRAWAPTDLQWPDPRGLAFVAGGSLLFVVAGRLNIAKEWLQGGSLVLNLCGAALLLGGAGALRWLWPSLVFLMFMFPLPYDVEHRLGWPLQKVAAMGSEFTLQTLGYPTFREGVILHVQDHVLEVQNACNGLSMLLTFFTLSAALAIVVHRPWLDRVIIILSAVPIAILSNVIRIAVTGVLYNEAGRELGDKVFHDFAGWMMMPLAFGALLLELKLLDWVLLEDLGKASREEVIKNVASKPAYLFMTDFPAADGGGVKPAPANPPRGSGR
ncbi:MAG: Transrane exosortase [Gemmataceae bacterium]|nr:Transrane exosortase [Gemmataceae bacterium]